MTRKRLLGWSRSFGPHKRLSDRLGRLIDWRIGERIPPERLDGYDRRLDEALRQLFQERSRLDELISRVNGFHDRAEWTASQVERVVPQVASQEAELESLRAKLVVSSAADLTDVDAARSLIDEVRREHAQVRVRLTGIARYEERLRRLEESSAEE
jgi:hypothetical protein